MLVTGILAVGIIVVLGAAAFAVSGPAVLGILAVIALAVGLLPRSRRRRVEPRAGRPGKTRDPAIEETTAAEAGPGSSPPSQASERRWTMHWELVPPGAIALVRARATEELAPSNLPREQVETVLLVITELLSNAVEHGRPPIRLHVTVSGRWVRVEVQDAGPGGPQKLPLDPQRLRGRGVQLVEAVSSEWGWMRDPTGKTVWTSHSVGPPP